MNHTIPDVLYKLVEEAGFLALVCDVFEIRSVLNGNV